LCGILVMLNFSSLFFLQKFYRISISRFLFYFTPTLSSFKDLFFFYFFIHDFLFFKKKISAVFLKNYLKRTFLDFNFFNTVYRFK